MPFKPSQKIVDIHEQDRKRAAMLGMTLREFLDRRRVLMEQYREIKAKERRVKTWKVENLSTY